MMVGVYGGRCMVVGVWWWVYGGRCTVQYAVSREASIDEFTNYVPTLVTCHKRLVFGRWSDSMEPATDDDILENVYIEFKFTEVRWLVP